MREDAANSMDQHSRQSYLLVRRSHPHRPLLISRVSYADVKLLQDIATNGPGILPTGFFRATRNKATCGKHRAK